MFDISVMTAERGSQLAIIYGFCAQRARSDEGDGPGANALHLRHPQAGLVPRQRWQHLKVGVANDGRRLRLVRQQRVESRKQRQLRYLQRGFRFGFALLHTRINRLRRQREREVTNDGAQRMLLPIIYAEGRTAMRVLQQGQAVEGAVGRICRLRLDDVLGNAA